MTVREYWENYNDSGDAFMSLPKYNYVDIVIYQEENDEYDRFVVSGNESWGEEYYDAEYPIEDIVREFEDKWGMEVKEYLENLKHIQDTEDYLYNMYKNDVNFYLYQMIITEGADYGIKFKECYCPYKGYYIEF
jgi:hypothetical protein